MKKKKYILIIIFLLMTFTLNVSVSLALTTPQKTFDLTKNKYTGFVDISAENKVKVCKDVTCTNPVPGIIDFEISGDSPLSISSENGLTGKVWGDELGWITFSPPSEASNLSYKGVSFADFNTGLLKGTAWSENSGAINFSVTGQKVFIDLNTGEWKGWAWASGKYGGWIKFDCQSGSCVKTIWNSETKEIKNTSNTEKETENQKLKEKIWDSSWIGKVQTILPAVFNNFIFSFKNLYNKLSEALILGHNSAYLFSKEIRTSLLENLNRIEISDRAFKISAKNSKYLFDNFDEITIEILDSAGGAINNFFNYLYSSSKEIKDKIFKEISQYPIK